MNGPPVHRWPPLLRALLAQALAFGLLLLLARAGLRLPAWGWAAGQALGAALLAGALRLDRWWLPWHLLLPFAVLAASRHALPAWAWALLFLGMALVFGGGVLTRVPLYNASRDAWRRLEDLLPPEPGFLFVDLGCGLGGPLAHLAARRPDGRFLGVEASPGTFLLAWLRCLPRPNVRIRLGSLWAVDLAQTDLAYAFLSPEPMPRLWTKARGEMRPGTRFISHSFEVPGTPPARTVPVAGRPGARLMVWDL